MSAIFKAILFCWFLLSQAVSDLTAGPVFSLQNLKAEGTGITEQLSALNLHEQVRLIWGLEGNTWHFYSENSFPYEQYPAIRPLERLESGYGYWIQYKDGASQTPASNSGPYKINILRRGYALIDPGLQTEINIDTLFSAQTISSGNPSDINEVWLWDASTKSWLFHSGNPKHASKQIYAPIKTLRPGQAIWIKTAVDGLTITPPEAVEPVVSVEGGADELSAPLLSGLRISPFPTLYKNQPYPQKTDNGWLCEFENEDAPAFDLHYAAATEAGKEVKSITVTHRFWPATGPMQENILVHNTEKPVKTYGHISIAPSEKGLHHYVQTVGFNDNSTLNTTAAFIVKPQPQSGLTRLFASMGQIQPVISSVTPTIGTTVDPITRENISKIRVTVTGPGIETPIVKEFSGTAESGKVNVPPGTGRIFQVAFFDYHNDIVRLGEVVQNVEPLAPGQTATAQIARKNLTELGLPEFSVTPSGYFVTDEGRYPLNIEISKTGTGSLIYTSAANLPTGFDLKNPEPAYESLIHETTASTLSITASETTTLLIYAKAPDGTRGGVHKYEYWRTQRPGLFVSESIDNQKAELTFNVDYKENTPVPAYTTVYVSENGGEFQALGIIGNNYEQQLILTFNTNKSISAYAVSQYGWEGLNRYAKEIILPGVADAVNYVRNKTSNDIHAAYEVSKRLKDDTTASATDRIQAQFIHALTAVGRRISDAETTGTKTAGLLDKLGFNNIGRNIFNFTAEIARDNYDGLMLGDLNGIYEFQDFLTVDPEGLQTALTEGIASLNILINSVTDKAPTDTILSLDWFGETITFQKKDLFLLRSGFYGLEFAANLVSSHNFDLSDTTITTLLTNKSISGVTNLKEVIERYSGDLPSETEVSDFESIQLIEALKLEPTLLSLRTNGAINLSRARSSLINFLSDLLIFTDIIEELGGGSIDSAFYVETEDMKDISTEKRSLLAAWNNLNGTYHASIGVKFDDSYLTTTAWYQRILAETLYMGIESSGTVDPAQIVFHEWLYSHEKLEEHAWNPQLNQPEVFYGSGHSLMRANLNAIFSGALRDKILNVNKELANITSDDELEYLLNGGETNIPSPSMTDLFPGGFIFDEEFYPRETFLVSSDTFAQPVELKVGFENFSADWDSVQNIWIDFGHEHIQAITKPSVPGNYTATLINMPLITRRMPNITLEMTDRENNTFYCMNGARNPFDLVVYRDYCWQPTDHWYADYAKDTINFKEPSRTITLNKIPGASISGTITSTDGYPVAGAIVMLMYDDGVQRTDPAISDVNGFYSFNDIPLEGSFKLQVFPSDPLSGLVPGYYNPGTTGNYSLFPPGSMTVISGSTYVYNLSIPVVSENNIIAGFVEDKNANLLSFDLTGYAEAVVNLRVYQAIDQNMNFLFSIPIGYLGTDGTNPIINGVLNDGFYAVPMPDGNYFLEVITDPPAYQRSFYTANNETGPSIVTVSPAAPTGANFALTETKGRISGTVNYAGAPANKGAKIILYEYDNIDNALKARATTSADSNGNYQFYYLPYPETEYFVKAIPYQTEYIPGFYNSNSNISTPSAPSFSDASGIAPSGTIPYISNVDFYLETGTIYYVNGKTRDFNPSTITFGPLNMQTELVFMDVFSAENPNTLLDSSPIGWREQTMSGPIGRGALSIDPTGGEEHGSYSLGLIPGNYLLRVRALDMNMNNTYTPFWYTLSGGSENQTEAATVSLLSGNLFGTDFNLLPINTTPDTNPVMEISGTIFYSGTVDQTNPASIFLYQYNDTNPANFTMYTTADINGSYIFHNVQPNTYVLRVVPGDSNYYSAYHRFDTSLPDSASSIFRQEASEITLNEMNTQANDINFHLNTGIAFGGYVKETTDSGLQPLSNLSQWVSLNVANSDNTKTENIAIGWRDQTGSYGVLNDGFYSLTLPSGGYYLRVDADSTDPSINYPSLFYNSDTGTTDQMSAAFFQLTFSGQQANFVMPQQSGGSTAPVTPEIILSSRHISIQPGKVMAVNFKIKPEGQTAYLAKVSQPTAFTQFGLEPSFSATTTSQVTSGQLYFQTASFSGQEIVTFNISFDGSNYQPMNIMVTVDPEMRVNLDGFGKKTHQLTRTFGDKIFVTWANENQPPLMPQLKGAVFSLQSDGITTPTPVRVDGGDILISEDTRPLSLLNSESRTPYDITTVTNGFMAAWESNCPLVNSVDTMNCIYIRAISNPETDPVPIRVNSNLSIPSLAFYPSFLRKSESDLYLLWMEDNAGNFSYHYGRINWDGASNLNLNYLGALFTGWTTKPLDVSFVDLAPASPANLIGLSLINQEYQEDYLWQKSLWAITTNNNGEPPTQLSSNIEEFSVPERLINQTENAVFWTEKVYEQWDEEFMEVELRGAQFTQSGNTVTISTDNSIFAKFKQKRFESSPDAEKTGSLKTFKEFNSGSYAWEADVISQTNFDSFSIGNGLILAGGTGKVAVFDNINSFEAMQPATILTGVYLHSSAYFALAEITEPTFQPFEADLSVWTNGQKALIALNDDYGSVIIGYNNLPAAIEASNGNLNAVTASFVLTGPGAWVPEMTAFQKSDQSWQMIIADEENHRVIMRAWPETEDIVIDLNDTVTARHIIGIGVTPESNPLTYPAGVWTDGTRLLIADDSNSRIVYFTMDTAGEITSDGLEILNGNSVENPELNLQFPRSVYIYDDLLAVADTVHHRVLIYSGASTMDLAFHSVIGQPDTSSAITLFNGQLGGLSLPWTVVVSDTFIYVTGEDGIKRYNYTGSGSGASITTQAERVFGMNQTDILLGFVGLDYNGNVINTRTYGQQRYPLTKYSILNGVPTLFASWLESALSPLQWWQYNQFNGDGIVCLIDAEGQTPFPAVQRNSRKILRYDLANPLFDGINFPFYIWTEQVLQNGVDSGDTQLYIKPVTIPVPELP